MCQYRDPGSQCIVNYAVKFQNGQADISVLDQIGIVFIDNYLLYIWLIREAKDIEWTLILISRK